MTTNDARERILEAASRLFLQYGHKHTTVEMIASEVGISKGSVYLHFQSKDEVFAAASERVCRQVLDAMAATARNGMPVEEKLRKLFLDASLQIWDFAHQAPHAPALWTEMLQAASEYALPAYDEALRVTAGVIAEGQQQGVFSEALEATTAARVLQMALQGFDLPYLLIDSREQIERELPMVMDVFLQGLKTMPALPHGGARDG